jgi:hypothetical protein
MSPKHPKPFKRTNSPPRPQLSLPELDDARIKANSHFAPYIPQPPLIAAGKIGRPSTYDPKYCQTVLEHAALGHTLGATAALIGVTRSTLHEWASIHPEFSAAVARAKGARQLFYESHLIDMVRRGGDPTRMSAVKLGLLNVGGDDWKERLTSEHKVEVSWAALLQESLKPLEGSRTITIEGELAEKLGD